MASGTGLEIEGLARGPGQLDDLQPMLPAAGDPARPECRRIERLDRQQQAVEVAHRRIALPLSGETIAQQQVVAVLAEEAAAFAEAVTNLVDMLGRAGQEQPAGAG